MSRYPSSRPGVWHAHQQSSAVKRGHICVCLLSLSALSITHQNCMKGFAHVTNAKLRDANRLQNKAEARFSLQGEITSHGDAS